MLPTLFQCLLDLPFAGSRPMCVPSAISSVDFVLASFFMCVSSSFMCVPSTSSVHDAPASFHVRAFCHSQCPRRSCLFPPRRPFTHSLPGKLPPIAAAQRNTKPRLRPPHLLLLTFGLHTLLHSHTAITLCIPKYHLLHLASYQWLDLQHPPLPPLRWPIARHSRFQLSC